MGSTSSGSSRSKVFLDANLLIYLNTCSDPAVCDRLRKFFLDIISSYDAYTDILVLDELLYISKKKYGVPYDVTLDFVENIMKVVGLIPLGEKVLRELASVLRKHNLKPSDAVHLAAMRAEGIRFIVSEDTDYDGVDGVKRIWLEPDQSSASSGK